MTVAVVRCEICRFFDPDSALGGGLCRRRSPGYTAFAGDVSERTGARMVEEVSGWPYVDRTDWCGEFKPAAGYEDFSMTVEPRPFGVVDVDDSVTEKRPS